MRYKEVVGSVPPFTALDDEGLCSRRLRLNRRGYGTSLERDCATYSYTPTGQLESMTDARGYRAEMEYDGFDRQTHWYFPNPNTAGVRNANDYEQYFYDKNGNRTRLRKRDGTLIDYTYDNLNRVRSKKIDGSTTSLAAAHRRDVWYTYTVFGEVARTTFDGTSGEGTRTFFDTHGRLTKDVYYDGSVYRALEHTYDEAGNRTSLEYPDGETFSYLYSVGGQFKRVLDPGSNILFNFLYDSDGRLGALTRNSSAPTQDFTYDGLGRLETLGWANAGTSSVLWSYTRNPASQILSETQSNDDYSWNLWVPGDPGSAPAFYSNTPYVANGLNQYTSVDGTAFCYDPNGNLTADNDHAYRYDAENRLVEMRARTGTGCPAAYTGQMKAALSYDPLGRLATVENYIGGVAQGPTRFLHDGDALVAEYNSSGAMLARHVHGPAAGADDPLVSYPGSSALIGDATFLYADPRGSVVFTADRTNAAHRIMTYDPYGVPGSGHGTFGRFGYTGQVWLTELGMNYYKARIYSPTLGRFLQTDPIGYQDNVNLYAYVANDPINRSDPTGTRDIYIGGAMDKDSTRIVQSYAERQMAANPNRDIQYYSWAEVNEIAAAIDAPLTNGEPLNVIGHSLGGAEAIRQSHHSANQITNLITIDPVSHVRDGSRSDSVSAWSNIIADPADTNMSDVVASTGRAVLGTTDTSGADINRTSSASHGDFPTMMSESNAPQAIDRSYDREPRR